MTTRQAMLFFALSTWKTVDDHCGFALPWDPVQHLFGNNADYHDIHRAFLPVVIPHFAGVGADAFTPHADQIGGLKKNYSQPYFIHFECVLPPSFFCPICHLVAATDSYCPSAASSAPA